jgi:rRNA maturation endonuclease Nob1
MFCSNCGKEISDNDYFCSYCGARTRIGAEKGVSYTSDDVREAFQKMGQEMEKAFQTAAKEIQKAFKTARQNIKTQGEENITCSNCNTASPNSAVFCYKCGKKLE